MEVSAALFTVDLGPLRRRGYRVGGAVARELLAMSSSDAPTSCVDDGACRRSSVQPVLFLLEEPLPGWFVVYFEPASEGSGKRSASGLSGGYEGPSECRVPGLPVLFRWSALGGSGAMPLAVRVDVAVHCRLHEFRPVAGGDV